MIGYVTLGTADLAKAAVFYDAVLGALGAKRVMNYPGFIAWGRDKEAMVGVGAPFDGQPASVGNGTMIALEAKDRAQIHAVYDIALAQGGTCEGPPGPRGDSFYAGYFRDLDGNKLNVYMSTSAA